MDNISDFSDGILHHILSFLPTKDALRTSVLSRRWKLVLDTCPILDFSWGDFVGDGAMYFGNASEECREKLGKFVNYVDASILRFCKYEFSLQKFKLFVVLPDLELASRLDKWVQLVTEKDVKEFDFGIDLPGYFHLKKLYTMPESIFAATPVTFLKLYGCNVKLEESFCIKLHSLQKLALREVRIDDHVVEKLVTYCSLIDDICLKFCWGFKKIQVSGLPRLKKFEICSYTAESQSLDIRSSSLESFHCLFSSQSAKHIVRVDACLLKTLYLCGSFVTELLLQHLVPKCSVLESLTLCDCLMLNRLKISSWSLLHLQISSCKNIMDIEIDAPNLLSCKYFGSVVPISSINAPSCQWQVEFSLTNTINSVWYMMLKQFLAKLNQLVYLHIYVYVPATKISFDPEDLDDNLSPRMVNNVALTVHPASPISSYSVFMDGLFHCFHPDNLFIRSSNDQNRYVEYLSRFLERDLLSCDHKNIKCWRHDLKEVKIETLEEGADMVTVVDNRMTFRFFRLARGHTHCKMEW